ncbi:uncharacterized protein LOC132295611 [Cornus florida]|uniref:uncharacterized protein LOC132295611 n=1 Tax=Cornus florida TaxID=4283 RepID=UPI00289C3658|nr:uncharacterized protein LOC132295611 [Cornus florida]
MEEETISHMLCKCSIAQVVWKSSPLRLTFPDSSSCSWQHNWLYLLNLWHDHQALERCLSLVSFIMWQLWKGRNDWHFNSKKWSPHDIIDRALFNFHEFWAVLHQDASIFSPQSFSSPHPSSWQSPILGRLKLNIDAAFNSISHLAGVVPFSRMTKGDRFGAPLFFENVGSPAVTEALTLRESLKLLSSWGHTNVDIESDNQRIMQLQSVDGFSFIIVEDIACLLPHMYSWKLLWTLRICNRVAHFIGKWALRSKCSDLQWDVWPPGLIQAIEADL